MNDETQNLGRSGQSSTSGFAHEAERTGQRLGAQAGRLADAAGTQTFVSHPPLDAIHEDLQAIQPWLRVCRKRLVDVAPSYESHPKLADLHRDKETLRRLRRVHRAFGEAFRNEQVSREVDALDH